MAGKIIRAFSGVDEEFVVRRVPADTLARNDGGAKKKVVHRPARGRAGGFKLAIRLNKPE